MNERVVVLEAVERFLDGADGGACWSFSRGEAHHGTGESVPFERGEIGRH